MIESNQQLEVTNILSPIDTQDTGIEKLRQILISEQLKDVSYDEAKYIGESLIEFFEVLADQS